MKQITENDGIHKEWYAEAKTQTLETLPKFLEHLMKDYGHDYGTICHALAAGAIATAWALNDAPQGGITGFQAGAVMWQFIQEWSYESNKCGLRLINYDNFLYPQYENKFEKTIGQSTWDAIQKQAKENLKDIKHANKSVVQHWQSIVDGNIPFGYKISER